MSLKRTAPSIAAVLLTASAQPRPVNLIVTPTANGIEMRVVGKSDSAMSAKFTLEVKGGGNTSVQGGTARLVPGQTATLVHLTLGPSARQDWQAQLHVDLDSGSYDQVEGSGHTR